MEKRLILAVTLSIVVLFTWSAFVEKTGISPKTTLKKEENVISSSKASIPEQIKEEKTTNNGPREEIEPVLFKFSQNNVEFNFIESLGAIKEAIFKDYQNYKFSLTSGGSLGDENLSFQKQKVSGNKATFIYRDKEKQITKEFVFLNSNYTMELSVKYENMSNVSIVVKPDLNLGVLNFSRDQNQSRYQDVMVALKNKTLHFNSRKDNVFKEIKFLGFRDRYFCIIIEPDFNCQGIIKKIASDKLNIGVSVEEVSLAAGQQFSQNFRIYLGPQDVKIINNVNSEWTKIIYYGFFDLISHFLLQVLKILYNLVHSWGIAIILLSLFIYILLFPLSLKQMKSMKQMQMLQPRMEELKKLYNDNPQKLNKEMLELYREHKVNPLGGCLPLILQIPIFFALYQALMRFIELKGANFLWIKDLSEPDRLFLFSKSIPIIGNEFNLLPILMAIGMFAQQKISMVSTNTASAEQQKLMMFIFPIMFGIIFYHMPAGLVLYWFTNSLFTTAYQFRVNRKI